MRNFIRFTFCPFLFLLFSTTLNAQTIDVDITPPLDTAGACRSNLYSAEFIASGTHHIRIQAFVDSTDRPGTCGTSPLASHLFIQLDTANTTATVSNIQVDTVLGLWTGTVTNIDTVILAYHLYIDCSIVPGSGGNQNINLFQVWSDPVDSSDYILNFGDDTLLTPNISFPFLLDISPKTYVGGYLNTVNELFMYKNTGDADAIIKFRFFTDSSTYCGQIQHLSLTYGVGVNDTLSPLTSGNLTSAILSPNDTLIIIQQVRDTSCLDSCIAKAHFVWGCDYALNSGIFCPDCQNTPPTTFQIKNAIPDFFLIERLSPSNAAYDLSCMNDTAGMVQWEYRITNTGIGALDSVFIDLSSLDVVDFLTLVPLSSLEIDTLCAECTMTSVISPRTNFLCAGFIPNPLLQAQYVLNDFGPQDTILLRFKTFRCVQEDDSALLNTPKFYNQWKLKVTAKGICGNNAIRQGNIFFGSFGISSNSQNSGSDIDQDIIFSPSQTDLSVPADTAFGEYALMEIELNSLVQTSPLDYQLLGYNGASGGVKTKGFIRATVHCNLGLRLENPATNGKLKIFNSITGIFDYVSPDYYHTSVPDSVCIPGDYFYYFDLSDSLGFASWTNGFFEFELQACCTADSGATPYDVSFHLMSNPDSCYTLTFPDTTHTLPPMCTGVGCEWLPLSSRGKEIAVHCPGCLAPGIIVDDYAMRRVSFGLQDSNNDGRADVGMIPITDTSAWYTARENVLKRSYSSFGDKVEDYLTAHFQAGDSTDGGYTYVQMENLGVHLPFLQLSRLVPAALDTMKLLPTGFTLYIDTPVVSQANCIGCEDFQVDTNQYRTQYVLEVSGNDVYQFLDTVISANRYLFTFESRDSSGTLIGNLHTNSFISHSDTLSPFRGYFEGQGYRLKVSYDVCGNFMPGIADLYDIDNIRIESEIANQMWLSGIAQSHDAFSNIPQMPNTVAVMQDSLGWTLDTTSTTYTLINDTFASTHLFYCETYGGLHYFYTQDGRNASKIVDSPGCSKTIEVWGTARTAGGSGSNEIINIYPLEYRPTALWPDQYDINVPAGYHITQSRVRNEFTVDGQNRFTNWRNFIPTSLSGSFSFSDSILPAPVCLADSATFPLAPVDTNMYVGSRQTLRRIHFTIEPDSCGNNIILPNDTAAIIHFDKKTYACIADSSCSLDSVFTRTMYPVPEDPLAVMPNLNVQVAPLSFNVNSHQVCVNVEISNLSITYTGDIESSAAGNVFIALPGAGITPFLSNWTFFTGDTLIVFNDTILPTGGQILQLTSSLAVDSIIEGQLCAEYTSCQESAEVTFHVGWNCTGFPTSPFDADSVCGVEEITYEFWDDSTTFSTVGKNHPPTYSLCTPIVISAPFQSNSAGSVYPQFVTLDSIPNLTIVEVNIQKCDSLSNPTMVTLSEDSIPGNYPISGSHLSALGISDSSISAGECIRVLVTVIPECGFVEDLLPAVTLNSLNFCNETFITDANFEPDFDWDLTSACPSCFTIEKFALDTVAFIGAPFTFYVAACNLSADTNIVTITDLIPPGFTPTSAITFIDTLQSMECDTFAITGFFSASDTCPNSTNTALLIHAGDTISGSWCVSVISTTDLCIAQADTVWTGVLYSTSLPKTFSNDTIYIADSLIVNDTLEFFNSRLIIGGGGSITVVDSGYLYVANTIVEACDTMWQGIYVNSLGKLMVNENSVIADANVAVMARNKSFATIIYSKLLDNARNVVIPVTSGITTNTVTLIMHSDTIAMDSSAFKPNYIGQPSHGSLPASGVEANNWVGTIGSSGDDKKNVFIDMITGIIGKKSQLILENNEFGRIKIDTSSVGNATYKGLAVFVSSDTSQAASSVTIGSDNYFYSCKYGTYTSNCITTISGVAMDTMTYGVHVRNCIDGSTTRVENCTINASYRGIDMLNNAGSSEMAIVGNTITVKSDASATAAIKMQEATFGEAFYRVFNNNITIIGARDGILAVTVYGAGIRNNRITQSPDSVINSNRGITLNGCDSVTVSCNELVSTYTISSGNVATGIGVSESSSSSILCNTVDEHNRGIFFGGICGGTNFSGNRMGRHYVGLYLNTAAAIDQQYYHGNIWDDTTKYASGYGAVNMNDANPANLIASLFSTNQTVTAHNPKYPTDTILGPFNVDDNNWFAPFPTGSSFNCATSTVCADTVIGGGDALRMMIVDGDTLTSEFIPESQIIANQYLYDVLKKDSILLSNTIYQTFLQDNEFETVGYLHQAKVAFKSAGSLDDNLRNIIIDANAIIALYSDSIHYLDSLAALNPNSDYTDQREIFVDLISDQKEIIENALQQQQLQDSIILAQAETANNLVTPTELPDENEKFINSITTLFLKDGVNAIVSNYNQILTIANQCPYEGGIPVYRARIFVSLLNDSIGYDDETVCQLQGIYRQSIHHSENVIDNGIFIRPNPTSDYAEIILKDHHEGICNIEIKDMTGRTVYTGSFDCKVKSKKVDVSSLVGGVYTVTVAINDRFVKSSKLSIVR